MQRAPCLNADDLPEMRCLIFMCTFVDKCDHYSSHKRLHGTCWQVSQQPIYVPILGRPYRVANVKLMRINQCNSIWNGTILAAYIYALVDQAGGDDGGNSTNGTSTCTSCNQKVFWKSARLTTEPIRTHVYPFGHTHKTSSVLTRESNNKPDHRFHTILILFIPGRLGGSSAGPGITLHIISCGLPCWQKRSTRTVTLKTGMLLALIAALCKVHILHGSFVKRSIGRAGVSMAGGFCFALATTLTTITLLYPRLFFQREPGWLYRWLTNI